MRRQWRVVSLVVILVAVLATAATAGAAGTPSLAGEVMLAGVDSGAPSGTSIFEVNLRCGAAAPSWWTYSASGSASGPYPGTFTESGTVYVDAPAPARPAPC